jgi:hypothetical protein
VPHTPAAKGAFVCIASFRCEAVPDLTVALDDSPVAPFCSESARNEKF